MKKVIFFENNNFTEYEEYSVINWLGQVMTAGHASTIPQSPYFMVEYEIPDGKIMVDYILENNIVIPIFYNSVWEHPKRPIRLTIPVQLSRTPEYKDFSTLIFARQTKFTYDEVNDTNTVYFDYLEKTGGLFTLEDQKIICADQRLIVELLFEDGYKEDDIKIYR